MAPPPPPHPPFNERLADLLLGRFVLLLRILDALRFIADLFGLRPFLRLPVRCFLLIDFFAIYSITLDNIFPTMDILV